MTDLNASQTLILDLPVKVRHIPTKRLFDIFFSFFALFFLMPLFFIIALAILFTSKGKSVYSHERVGRGGKPFRCYKFRTMYTDADARLKEILAKSPEMRAEWESCHKLKNDPRVTPVGAFLRKTSLDELPQFWNVLTGDLSIVGPRPVVRAEIKKFYGPRAACVLSIRPGITGLWQVSGRSNTSYDMRVKLDEEYVKKQSLWLDFKLILKTVPSMIFRKGAY